MSVGDLNWLDWVVIAVVALSALEGTRRGLLLGVLDLATSAVGLAVAFIFERPLGDALTAWVPGIAPALAHLGAFVVLLIGTQILISATIGRLVWAAANVIARSPFGGIDRLLGLLPGLVRGVATVTLVLLPFALVSLVPPVSTALAQSTVGDRLVGVALQVLPTVEARLGQDLQGGLPELVVAPPESESETTQPLPLGPPSGALVADPVAEQRTLDLMNGERTRMGLKPLAADDRLRDVARQHSLEMFQMDYFSHTSPVSGSPFDRMRAAGIEFLIAGENLAYAPDVEVAHQGLMNSPGHRANILRPEFGRVGIGVIRSQAQGSMFTQDFTN